MQTNFCGNIYLYKYISVCIVSHILHIQYNKYINLFVLDYFFRRIHLGSNLRTAFFLDLSFSCDDFGAPEYCNAVCLIGFCFRMNYIVGISATDTWIADPRLICKIPFKYS